MNRHFSAMIVLVLMLGLIGCKTRQEKESCEDPDILGACSMKNSGIYYVIKGQKSDHIGTVREEVLHNANIYKFKKLKNPKYTKSGIPYKEEALLMEREVEVKIKIYE